MCIVENSSGQHGGYAGRRLRAVGSRTLLAFSCLPPVWHVHFLATVFSSMHPSLGPLLLLISPPICSVGTFHNLPLQRVCFSFMWSSWEVASVCSCMCLQICLTKPALALSFCTITEVLAYDSVTLQMDFPLLLMESTCSCLW